MMLSHEDGGDAEAVSMLQSILSSENTPLKSISPTFIYVTVNPCHQEMHEFPKPFRKYMYCP